VLDTISEVGFKGFELLFAKHIWSGHWLPFSGDKNRFLDTLSKREMQLASIYSFGTYILGVDYSFDEIPFHLWWKHWQIPKIARFASSVGCKKLVLGGGYPYLKKIEEIREKDYEKMAKFLNKIGKICENYGVTVNYHPHPEPHPYTIQSVEQINKLFELTDPDLVHLTLDTGFAAAEIDFVEVIHTHSERIKHVHFKDYCNGNFVDLGEGIVNFPLILKTLKSIGYDDWVMIEDWYPPIIERTPLESAKNSKAYIDEYLNTL